MDELSRFQKPIPLAKPVDWSVVPPPRECGEALVDITDLNPRIRYGAAYLAQGLPGAMERLYVRQGVWERLQAAVGLLPPTYTLLVFDGLRTLRLQKSIYEQFRQVVQNERPGISPAELELVLVDFVSKPVKRLNAPTPHSTGGAVDLTLCKDGIALDMGTGFDDLTDMAHTDWYERACIPGEEQARDDRRLLYHIMVEAGFVGYDCEWWHYGYGERMWAREKGCAPIYGFCPECDFEEGD